MKNKKYKRGKPLHYNISDQLQYAGELRRLVEKMRNETEREIKKFFGTPVAEKYFIADAGIADSAQSMINKLKSKFFKIFSEKAFEFTEKMAEKTVRSSAIALESSFEKLVESRAINMNFIPKELKQGIKSVINENVSLITGISEEYFKNITSAVMTSITTGGGVDSLIKNLKRKYELTDTKARNIAFDQTRKAYNAINKQRMTAVGYDEFEWLHSGGGMHPRKSHLAMNGKIYSFDKLPVINQEQVDKGYEAPVHGIPGQAINCGCTMIPVYRLPTGE